MKKIKIHSINYHPCYGDMRGEKISETAEDDNG